MTRISTEAKIEETDGDTDPGHMRGDQGTVILMSRNEKG